MTGLRVASASSVAILLASTDTRLTSAGSRWREELLLSPLGPVNMDRVESSARKAMKKKYINSEACGSAVEL